MVLYGGRDSVKYTEVLLRALRIQETFTTVAEIPKSVVAAITGFAVGGGCELARTADRRIRAANARIGPPETTFGVDSRSRRHTTAQQAGRSMKWGQPARCVRRRRKLSTVALKTGRPESSINSASVRTRPRSGLEFDTLVSITVTRRDNRSSGRTGRNQRSSSTPGPPKLATLKGRTGRTGASSVRRSANHWR